LDFRIHGQLQGDGAMKTQVLARIAPGHGQAGRDADGRGGAAPGELEFRVSGDQLTVQLQEVRLPAPRSAACTHAWILRAARRARGG